MTRTDQAVPLWRSLRPANGAVLVFVVIAVLAGADAVADLRSGLPRWNIGVDLTITAGSIIAGAVYWWRSVQHRRQAQALLRRLDAARADADHWRAEAASVLPALGAAIHRQFERWTLTPDEQQIALMLMNGLSSKKIADLRGSSVPAVRQMTFDVYRKAGVNGRAALAAFFLQDLLYLAGHPATARQESHPAVPGTTSGTTSGAHRAS